MTDAREPLSRRLRLGGAFFASLAAHAALFFWLLAVTVGVPTKAPPQPVLLELVRLPPPPPPPPPPPQPIAEPPPEPVKPVKRAPPVRRLPEKPAPMPVEEPPPPPPAIAAPKVVEAPPPGHAFSLRDDDWAPAVPVTGSGKGPRRVPPVYADEVKSRIIAKIDYPPDALYPKPKGFKGDPEVLRRQCTIPYEITVDRNGRMTSHSIEPCGDPLLDAAAEAALLKAGPFPPPPELGADHYVIYGSANFLRAKTRGSSTGGTP